MARRRPWASLTNHAAAVGRRMKALNLQEIDELNSVLLDSTGVDFSAYVEAETLDTIGELLAFPQHALRTILRPVSLVTALFVLLSLTIFTLFHADNRLVMAIALLACLLLGSLNGFVLGLITLLYRVSSDIAGLLDFALGQTSRLLGDIEAVWTRSANGTLHPPKLSTVFSGVMQIIIIPAFIPAVAGKIPFLGPLVTALVRRLVCVLAGSVSALLDRNPDNGPPQHAPSPASKLSEKTQKPCAPANGSDNSDGLLSFAGCRRHVEAIRMMTARLSLSSVRIVTWPLKLAFAAALSLSILLALLLSYVVTFF